MMRKNNSVLVTGGLGFIGKNFAKLSTHDFDRKLIVDKVTYASDLEYYYSTLKPLGWKLIVGDTKNINILMSGYANISDFLIINFAAESHVDRSFSNAKNFLDANASGTLSILDFCREHNNKLLHISTDEVYGEITGFGVKETAFLNPTNPYSATKAAADILVQTYVKCFKVDAKIVRANNIFGDRQYFEKVIPKAMYSAFTNKPFYIHGSKNLKRHFLHTKDFYSALSVIHKKWDDSPNQIFNIGAAKAIPIRELVEYIYNFYKKNNNLISIGEDRPFNDVEYQVNDELIRSLGWYPKVDFWDEIDQMCRKNDIFIGYSD